MDMDNDGIYVLQDSAAWAVNAHFVGQTLRMGVFDNLEDALKLARALVEQNPDVKLFILQ